MRVLALGSIPWPHRGLHFLNASVQPPNFDLPPSSIKMSSPGWEDHKPKRSKITPFTSTGEPTVKEAPHFPGEADGYEKHRRTSVLRQNPGRNPRKSRVSKGYRRYRRACDMQRGNGE
jgi:hypothetical protein